jgi:hypothetical protein
MAFDDYTLNAALSTTVADSFNDTEENALDVDVALADSFNEDNSTNDNSQSTVDLTDSFHYGSHNTETDTDDSGNTDSYNDSWEFTDNSVDDHSDNSTHDHSVNAGIRSYNTGFGDVGGAAAAAAGGGDLMIDNRSTIVDQSVNGNVAAFGPVFQNASSEAVVNSGDDAVVAGDDATVTYNIDQSTTMNADGDILIDSSKTVETAINSYNTTSLTSTWTDNSQDWDIEDSNNTYEWSSTVTESFNDEALFESSTDIDVDVNAIVDSFGAGIADDVSM